MSAFTLFTAGLACLAPFASAYSQPSGDSPSGNPISSPGLNRVVPVGQPFTVTWNPTTQGTVSLVLLKGAANNLAVVGPIAESIDNKGSFAWTPSTDLTAGPTTATGYGIQLIVDATGQYQYTTQFGISNDQSGSQGSPSSSPSISASLSWSSSASQASSAVTSNSSCSTIGSASSTADSATVTSTSDSAVVFATQSASSGSVDSVTIVTATSQAAAPTTLASSVLPVTRSATQSTVPTSAPANGTYTGGAAGLKRGFYGVVVLAGAAIFAM